MLTVTLCLLLISIIFGQRYPEFFDRQDLEGFGFMKQKFNPNPVVRPYEEEHKVQNKHSGSSRTFYENRDLIDQIGFMEDRILKYNKMDEYKEMAEKMKEEAEDDPDHNWKQDLQKVIKWSQNLNTPPPMKMKNIEKEYIMNPRPTGKPSIGMSAYWENEDDDKKKRSNPGTFVSGKEFKNMALKKLEVLKQNERLGVQAEDHPPTMENLPALNKEGVGMQTPPFPPMNGNMPPNPFHQALRMQMPPFPPVNENIPPNALNKEGPGMQIPPFPPSNGNLPTDALNIELLGMQMPPFKPSNGNLPLNTFNKEGQGMQMPPFPSLNGNLPPNVLNKEGLGMQMPPFPPSNGNYPLNALNKEGLGMQMPPFPPMNGNYPLNALNKVGMQMPPFPPSNGNYPLNALNKEGLEMQMPPFASMNENLPPNVYNKEESMENYPIYHTAKEADMKWTLKELPKEDDYKAPIRWVPLYSHETSDGLAKVTDPQTGRNFEIVVNDTVYVPIADYESERLGLTTTLKPVLTTVNTALRTVVRNTDLKSANEEDWLVFETIMGGRHDDFQCNGNACQARCHKLGCESMCNGDTCASGCVGSQCNTFCKGPGCHAMCIGEGCSAKCSGLSCEARCRGEGCEASCNSFSCRYVINSKASSGGGTWNQHFPQYDSRKPNYD